MTYPEFRNDYGRWHAIHTAPQCERFVCAGLITLGFAAHLPETRDTGIVRGKKVEIVRPAYPRYCFALFRETDQWMKAFDIEGVEDILSMTGPNSVYRIPVQLSSAEIERMFCSEMYEGITGWLIREGHIKPPSKRKLKRQRRRLGKPAIENRRAA